MKKKKATNKDSQSQNEAHSSTARVNSTNATTQKLFVLACLRERPHSSNELHMRGIYDPRARIFSLRQEGYDISTTWRYDTDVAGVERKIGVYSLLSEAKQ